MNPTQRTRIIAILKDELPGMTPRLRQVAKYIADHPAEFGLDSIRETARKSGVSTFTLVRMAERLGFDGFESLRAPFRHALLSGGGIAERLDWARDLGDRGGLGEAQAMAARNTMAIVQRSLERQVPDAVIAAAEHLLGARTVYVTAVRSSYSLAYFFNYVGQMALPALRLIPRHMGSAIDELSDAGPEDVLIAITVTPYSRETIEACNFAYARGVKLVLISDSDIVSPEFKPTATLIASILSTHHFACFSGVMAVIENLLAVLMRLGGPAAEARVAAHEALREQHNAYWASPKKTSVIGDMGRN